MTTMMITGITFLIIGVLLFLIGFWLNTNTPVQQRLPVLGIIIGVIGLFIMILA